MNNKHGFRFDRDEITQYITALYELDDLVMYALAEDKDPRVYDEKTRRVRFYFECLADSLWKAGVFKSQQEARNFIRADTDALQNVGGPGGLCPDDGLLDPREIAEGLVALRDLNEFLFQAPICLLSSGLSDDCTADAEKTGECFAVGAVARALEPGCKVDCLPVVVGPQGSNKSRAIQALVPVPAWFSDDLSTALVDRDSKESLVGKWIIELAEFPHIRREIEKVKAFFSRQVDRFRRPIGHRAAHPRRSKIWMPIRGRDFLYSS